MSRANDLDRFYDLLMDGLRGRLHGCRRLAECDGKLDWPHRGLYFFMEEGEMRADNSYPRIVRVGTHALTATSKTTLWKRLAQHRGTLNPLGGHHRGSIFRLHVGESLLRSGRTSVPVADTWGSGSNAPKETRVAEQPLEAEVSEYIGKMLFLWLGVENRPDGTHDRGYLERNSIALLSNFHAVEPLEPASPHWLGLHSSRSEIRRSGLWNVNHVGEKYAPAFLDTLQRYVEMAGREA